MERNLSYVISENDQGKTILEFLKSKGCTHNIIVLLKRTQKGIVLNNQWAYVNQVLKSKDVLEIKLVEEESSENIEPIEAHLNIVYEDKDILVINKPAHMPIHPSMGHHQNTLANAVCFHMKSQGENFVFRCVNRLDKDTSGLTIVAKNLLSAAVLNRDIKNRMIHREYLAIAEGLTEKEGTIDAPIGRKPGSTIEREINFETGERAVTHYHLLKNNDSLSLISLNLETGRTHQIRVHMASIGHPLLGDYIYGTKKESPNGLSLDRQALHSYRLSFSHPITGEKLEFSVKPPEDMAGIFPSLR